MKDQNSLLLENFDFELPSECIALEPVVPRDASRMLKVDGDGLFRDQSFKDLPDFLRAGDALVFNDSRVIPAALQGLRTRSGNKASIHVNLHKRLSEHEWLAFAKPFKRLVEGDVIEFGQNGGACSQQSLNARVHSIIGQGEVLLNFEKSGVALDEAISAVGTMPLPPYIASRRAVRPEDRDAYQTIYSAHDGSVAAPTAGLHFSDEMMKRIEALGVLMLNVTLHVGAGTFLPVKCDAIEDHKMHAEWGEVSNEVAHQIKNVKANGGRVFAVGTTSLRLLESSALKDGVVSAFSGETDIFITPGFKFNVVDHLLTNFHLPKSTLFMLVAAFSGLEVMQRAYAHAIKEKYRFYSYGDACLLSRVPR